MSKRLEKVRYAHYVTKLGQETSVLERIGVVLISAKKSTLGIESVDLGFWCAIICYS
jgi:hypothetical protein